MAESYVNMKEITYEHYREFIKTHKEIEIEEAKIKIGRPKRIKRYQPKDFKLETTNVWSFPDRGRGRPVEATSGVTGIHRWRGT